MPLRHRQRDALATSSVSSTPDGDVRVVIRGALDGEGAAAVARDVRWAALRSRSVVTIDYSRGGFVDSSGLRLLIEAEQIASARHIEFRLRPSGALQQLLEMTGLTRLGQLDRGFPVGA